MGDDTGGFVAPIPQKRTPTAVQLAGERLHRWAVDQELAGVVDVNTPLLERAEPDDQELARDFRLMRWYVRELESEP